MKIDRVFVLSYLNGKQIGQGGYYGADLSDLAKVMNVIYRSVRMRLTKWIKENLEAKIPYQQRHFIEERARLNYR